MPQITYVLGGGLAPKQLARLHEEAVGLVERVGLRVRHEGVRHLAAAHDGVRIEGDWVRFGPAVVEAAVRRLRYPAELRNADFDIISGAYSLQVTDLDTGAVRPATTDDLIACTRLTDQLGMLGSAPVRPTDITSPELQEVALYRYSWEHSPRKSTGLLDANPQSTVRVAEYVYELAQVAGKEFSLGLWEVSPFGTTESELEIIYRFRERNVRLWVATMPIAGATAPIYLPGAYVQSLAELLAGLALLHTISPAAPIHALVIDSIRAYPFDMRYGTFVYGTPEDLLGTLIQVQLNARYGIPVVAKSLLTTAKEPDAHAGAEKGAHTLAAALAGARLFTNAGLLSVDEIFSPEQAVMDREIVRYARRVCRGFEWSEETLALGAIEEVARAPRGTFLDHDTTLACFREAFFESELFDHTMLQRWQEGGARSLRERAREVARRLIAEHQYEPEPTVRRELERIWRAACDELS